MIETNTPTIEAYIVDLGKATVPIKGEWVGAGFARQLQEQLAAERAAREQAEREREEARAECEAAEKDRNELAASAKNWRSRTLIAEDKASALTDAADKAERKLSAARAECGRLGKALLRAHNETLYGHLITADDFYATIDGAMKNGR